MKKRWKRIGALLLSVCMIIAMMPTTALAEGGSGQEGSTIHVKEISSGTLSNKTELILHLTSGDIEVDYQGSIIKINDKNAFNKGSIIKFTVKNEEPARTGTIVITPHEGNDVGEDEIYHFDNGKNNYDGIIQFDTPETDKDGIIEVEKNVTGNKAPTGDVTYYVALYENGTTLVEVKEVKKNGKVTFEGLDRNKSYQIKEVADTTGAPLQNPGFTYTLKVGETTLTDGNVTFSESIKKVSVTLINDYGNTTPETDKDGIIEVEKNVTGNKAPTGDVTYYVALYENGTTLVEVKEVKKNGKVTFEGLDRNKSYQIKEVADANGTPLQNPGFTYTLKVGETTLTGGNVTFSEGIKKVSVALINDYGNTTPEIDPIKPPVKPIDPINPPDEPTEPTDPVDPVEPTEPTDPADPGKPVKPITPAKADKQDKDKPQTGDTEDMGLWLILLTLAASGMGVTLKSRRKEQ